MTNDHRLTKHWKTVEVMLSQASELLDEPSRFELLEKPLEDYRTYIDHNEFELAMDELAEIALEYGCKSGFWRRLKKVAVQMRLEAKADKYESIFQEALAHDV